MLKLALSTIAASLLALGFGDTAAQAQPARVFVSAQGSDGNPCTFASPCRTFQHAHDTVAAGGEIDVLDPAGYGVVTITKAISIQGHGFAGIAVSTNGVAFIINAGDADNVNISGLIIEGAGVGSTGIRFNTGASLVVENSIIRNLTGRGIEFIPTTLSSLAVSNTVVANNGGRGIFISPSGLDPASAVLSRVEVYNNTVAGISVLGSIIGVTVNVTVTDSVAHHNGGSGFIAETPGVLNAFLSVVRCVSANNDNGVQASGNAHVIISQSTITGNTTGWNNSGVLNSYGDNYIHQNGSNVGGALSLLSTQ